MDCEELMIIKNFLEDDFGGIHIVSNNTLARTNKIKPTLNTKNINLTKSQETELINLFKNRNFYYVSFSDSLIPNNSEYLTFEFIRNNNYLTLQYFYNITLDTNLYKFLEYLKPNSVHINENCKNDFLIKLFTFGAEKQINILDMYTLLSYIQHIHCLTPTLQDTEEETKQAIIKKVEKMRKTLNNYIYYLFRKVDTPKNNLKFLPEFYTLFYKDPINNSYALATQTITYRIEEVKLIFENVNINLKLDESLLKDIIDDIISYLDTIKDIFDNNKKLAIFKQDKDSFSPIKNEKIAFLKNMYYIPSLTMAVTESAVIKLIILSNDKQAIKKSYEEFLTVIKTGTVKIKNEEETTFFLSNLVNLLEYDNKINIINHIYLIKTLGLDNKKATSLINKLETVAKIDNKFLNNNQDMLNFFNTFPLKDINAYDSIFKSMEKHL